jgi:quercetin dioxygenase-like cupin family protein
MGFRLTVQDFSHGGEVHERFPEGAGAPRTWSNGPGGRYGWHAHGYHKVLYCVDGSIVFHGRGQDYALTPGDRLDIDAGTEHAATVGPGGVICMEAARPARPDEGEP